MTDNQHFECLEQQVTLLSIGKEILLKHMNNLFHAKHARDKVSSSNQQEPWPGGNDETSSSPIHIKPMRLKFPRYNGVDDPTIWLCRDEQCFEFQGIIEIEKVKLASCHMEKDAQV